MASPPAKRRRRTPARSALTVTADENTTTVQQGYAVASTSRQNRSGRDRGEPEDHSASSDSSQQKRSVDDIELGLIDKIAIHGNPVALLNIRTMFAQRCMGVNIYVDDMKADPTQVLYHTWQGMNSVQEYEVCIDTAVKIITSEMEKKWPSPVPLWGKKFYCPEQQFCLRYMWRGFKFVGERISYDRKKLEWIYNADAGLGSCSGTAVNEESGQSHLPEKKEESDTSQEEECHSDKPENQQEDEAKKDSLYKILKEYGLADFSVAARLISALRSQMRNSCGRDTVNMLLRCACAIAFGPAYEKEKGVFIYQVGTSKYPFEGFPVSSLSEYEMMAETNDTPEGVESPVPEATMPLALQLPGYCSPPTNVCRSNNEPKDKITSPASEASSHESSKSFGKGYIYPDLIVACQSGDQAKFLLLVEVKSNTSLGQSKSQVLRQGLGALVGQKEVYSLIISHVQASILKLCRYDSADQIAYDVKQYRLLGSKEAEQSFDSEECFTMFMDLIKVLDYAMENIVLT